MDRETLSRILAQVSPAGQSAQGDSHPKYNAWDQTARAVRGAKSQDSVVARALPSLKAPVQQIPGEQVEQPRYNSYDDALEAINQAYPVESDEDREKREKREKSQRLMAAIGDVFTSFSEGYDRASGKQVADGKSYTQQTDDRLMALEKVRQADAKSRVAALERLQQLKYQQQKGERDAARDKLAEKKAEEQAKQNEALRQKWDSEAQNTAYKLETDRKYKEGILDLKEEEQEINRKYKEGLITARDAQIQLGYARLKASQQPTTSHTVRTDKNGDYAGESYTVRSKGAGNSTKASKPAINNGRGNKSQHKTKTKTRI